MIEKWDFNFRNGFLTLNIINDELGVESLYEQGKENTHKIYLEMKAYYNQHVVISYIDSKGNKKVFDPHTNMDIAMHLMKHGYFDIYKNATIEVI